MLFTLRHIKLYVIGTQTFGQRSLSPLYPEVDVTRVTGRNLQRMLSEFRGPNSMWVDITCVCTASSLTVRFDPRWTVVVDARVAVCVLRIDSINRASTSWNNVGTSSFREILLSSGSQSEQVFSKRAKPVVFRRPEVCFLKQTWFRKELRPTTCYCLYGD